VFRELAYCPDVTFLRAFGQAAQLQTLDHSLSQFSHSYASREKIEQPGFFVGTRGCLTEV
jgi:hypothetical protein